MKTSDQIVWYLVTGQKNKRKEDMKKPSDFINPEKGKTYPSIAIFFGPDSGGFAGYEDFNHHDIEELHMFLFDKSLTHYVKDIIEDEELHSLVVYLKATTKDMEFKTNIDAEMVERIVSCLK